MDDAAIQRIKAMAQEALQDMPPAGIVGLAAFTEVSRLLSILEKLDAQGAQGALADVQSIAKDLEAISAGLDKGLHQNALEVALGRFATVSGAVARELERGKS